MSFYDWWFWLRAWFTNAIADWLQPASATAFGGLVADVWRSRPQLLLENALLRQQLIVLKRQVARPALTDGERRWLVILASRLQR
ncbi:MAG: hypothetical protein L0Z53_02535, partial [Acidobacteriales bacterium]|nr:hypothetical protein [Terriglobales bacterium]